MDKQYKVTQATEISGSGKHQKFAARFTATKDEAGTIAWSTRSGFVFNNLVDAIKGGERAIEQYYATGMFPNMCEKF